MTDAPSYKLTMPRVSDHVRREALLASLANAHRRAPLTWIVGLPGAGKTSLAAAWLDDVASAKAWYRLDERDHDVAALFGALGDALGATRPLPVWSPDAEAAPEDFARRFFARLAETPTTIVLDDCHRVADDSTVFAMLDAAREVAGDGLRIVAISRRAPPPRIARGVVGGWLHLVDDLRLTRDEAHAIATAARGGALDDATRREIDRADGWLAHVLARARLRDSAVVLGDGWDHRVGEFLATELLDSVAKGHRAALRRLAELPEIPATAPANPTFFPPEIARLLGTLAAQRYFVSGGTRYRLHDLLRDALLHVNAIEDDDDTRARVRRELATWVEDVMPDAAMQLRVLAKDTAGALALHARHAERWLAAGLHRTLVSWLDALPVPSERDTSARAALFVARAEALLPLEPEIARPLFREARAEAARAGDAARAYAAWCGEVGSYVVQWGAVQGLADLVDELEALAAKLGPPTGDLAFRTSEGALTALMYGRAEDPRTRRYADATARAVAHAPDIGARISAAAQLLIYKLWWAGDFAAGRALYDTFDAEVDAGDALAPLPRLLWWSCAAIVDWQCGDPAACYAKVERGLALANASGVHVRDFFLLTQGIFCALSQEDWERAEHYLKQLARTERQHKRLDTMVHHFFRSWHALCRGDARAALAHAETAWPIAESLGSMFHKVIVLSALAPARVHVGDLDGAEQAYREQLALAKAAGNPTFSFIAFCAGAEIAMARGDDGALAKQVERMLHVKHLGGFHSGCGWRTPMMRDVLAFALTHGIWPEVARRWIREKRISPPEHPPAGWPLAVRITGKGGLTVEIDGAAPTDAGTPKTARKLRELLAALVAECNGVTQAELCDWLWPDADGDKAAASLKVAIHRLRQWLGAEAVVVKDGSVALSRAVVGCDLWTTSFDGDASRVLAGFDLPPVLTLRARLARRAP